MWESMLWVEGFFFLDKDKECNYLLLIVERGGNII